MRKPLIVGILALAALAGGCKKEIYHGLSEEEANEIVVKLAEKGIESEKLADKAEGGGKKGAVFLISVDEEKAVAAQRLLLDLHLPKPEHPGMAEAFGTTSMIPTETEEKARYLT
ncbi:MAG TPA: hypothetical protein VHF22_13425, partial [Planctomycetota bacterium]|nr:hypothetical protein [Planctomycetota bacterium]